MATILILNSETIFETSLRLSLTGIGDHSKLRSSVYLLQSLRG